MGHYRIANFLAKKMQKSNSTEIDVCTNKGYTVYSFTLSMHSTYDYLIRLTPLMVSAQLGHVDIVHMLLRRGANPTLSWRGKDAVALAKDRKQLEVVKLFTVEPRDGWDEDDSTDKCTSCAALFTVTRRRV